MRCHGESCQDPDLDPARWWAEAGCQRVRRTVGSPGGRFVGEGLTVTPEYTSGTVLPTGVHRPGRYLLKEQYFNLIFISLDGFCYLNLSLVIQRGPITAEGFGFPRFCRWPVFGCCCRLFMEVVFQQRQRQQQNLGQFLWLR